MLSALHHPGKIQTRICAAISGIGWIAMFVVTGMGQPYAGSLFGLVYHLALAPVAAELPAPNWARMAGFVWIFSDAALDVARINGMDEANIWALRMGVHISAAIWITGSSLSLPRRMLIPGCLLGASLGIHAVIAPFVSQLVLAATAFPLMIIWLGMIAFTYSREQSLSK